MRRHVGERDGKVKHSTKIHAKQKRVVGTAGRKLGSQLATSGFLTVGATRNTIVDVAPGIPSQTLRRLGVVMVGGGDRDERALHIVSIGLEALSIQA